MRTSELTGALLDYWVAKAEGLEAEVRSYQQDPFGKGVETVRYCNLKKGNRPFLPSTSWAQGGSIIEREMIELSHDRDWREDGQFWRVWQGNHAGYGYMDGDTPLIAAMRVYVASKFGAEVQEGSGSNG